MSSFSSENGVTRIFDSLVEHLNRVVWLRIIEDRGWHSRMDRTTSVTEVKRGWRHHSPVITLVH